VNGRGALLKADGILCYEKPIPTVHFIMQRTVVKLRPARRDEWWRELSPAGKP
jgi:hypothetical protein